MVTRRVIILVLLATVLLPAAALAQGRVFSRGESGITGGIAFHGFPGDSQESYDGSTWVGVTLRNKVDLGIGTAVGQGL